MKKTLFWILAVTLYCAGLAFSGESKVLRMATEATFPPYEYYQHGKIVGIDVDIVETICRDLGYQLQVVDMRFDSVILAVKKGKCEIGAAGLTVTDERKRQVRFTLPYVTATQVILVPQNTQLKTLEDLKPKKVRIGVQLGTTGDRYASKTFHEPQRFDSAALAVAALEAGKLDAVVCDAESSKAYAKLHRTLKIFPFKLTSEEYAFAISEKNPELLKAFNKQLRIMRKDGRSQKILDKYLKDNCVGVHK